MRMFRLLVSLLFSPLFLEAQSTAQKLDAAFRKLQKDSQCTHAILSLSVVNSKTGTVLFNRNEQVGLAAASSQKVITSVAALELLGTDYTYKTELGYTGTIQDGSLNGDLVIKGEGDPSLGSWRYAATKENVVLDKWTDAIKAAGIKMINGSVVANGSKWESQTIPGGWIWDDIGNYYGAGVAGINWRENQYDLKLKPGGEEGDSAAIITTIPALYEVELVSELTTGKRGSGDNAVIFLPPQSKHGVVRGTIPMGENPFTVSGSFPDPMLQLKYTVSDYLSKKAIAVNASANVLSMQVKASPGSFKSLYTYNSPPLDSINYWFLRRSINLYGEALVKTISYYKTGFGSADSGLAIIRRFWKERGVESSALHNIDGSGLSPQNRITTNVLVTVMQYAKGQPYFKSFYNALPEINGIKMKSGSIGGARSFTGYIKSKEGNDYTFAVIINGYDGSSLSIVRKLYALLDVLK